MIPDHVPAEFRTPSDAAKRCSDAVNLAVVAGCAGRWLAIRLADGGCDNALYDSRGDAQSHQLRPQYCTYVMVPPDGMQPHEAEALLQYWRRLVDANVTDDHAPMPLMPLTRTDMARQIRVLSKGRR